MVKTLVLLVLFTGLFTLLKITQSFWYCGCCIIQTAAGKISKNSRDLYLVKVPKNTKKKEKAFVKIKAINLKSNILETWWIIRNELATLAKGCIFHIT